MSNENAAALPPKIEIARPHEDMCLHTGSGYACTRVKGHEGDHVAHGGDGEVCAVWAYEEVPHDLLLKAQDLAEAMRKHNLTHLGQLQLR